MGLQFCLAMVVVVVVVESAAAWWCLRPCMDFADIPVVLVLQAIMTTIKTRAMLLNVESS